MVVILFLSPYTTTGCDGGSNESCTLSSSTTSTTGDTVIPTKNNTNFISTNSRTFPSAPSTHHQHHQYHNYYIKEPTLQSHQGWRHQQPSFDGQATFRQPHNGVVPQHASSQSFNQYQQSSRYATGPIGHDNATRITPTATVTVVIAPQGSAFAPALRNFAHLSFPVEEIATPAFTATPHGSYTHHTNPTTCDRSPPPPPLPETQPPYGIYWDDNDNDNDNDDDFPTQTTTPRSRPKLTPRSGRSNNASRFSRLPTIPESPPHLHHQRADDDCVDQPMPPRQLYYQPALQQYSPSSPNDASSGSVTNTTDYVRHVTRVNFYDIDTSQVEFESKDDEHEDNNIADRDTEAITKEEEWITKRKTELTTTRQIETRVKRQVVLEDGKVVQDSGPIVSTNTTEDTDKQETETTEKRDLGIPEGDGIAALEAKVDGQIVELVGDNGVGGGRLVKKMVRRPSDGLVRESNNKRIVSHEEIKDYLETEDVKHMGDFSDEVYIKAVNSGAENVEEILLSSESQQQLVPLGPRIVANTTKSFKTIDSEDTQKRSLAQPDGTIITENKKTTEHEVIVDKELPEKDDHSTGSKEKITTVEASQRYNKQRDEQFVDTVVDGKVVGTEMRYAAETMQMEKDGALDRPGDWDSLSDRMRKLRRPHQKTLLQQQKEAALLADRKDALTKRPLDFDREEETRKGETMKWLESHFGSESTASNDSRDDDAEVEPTKKTYFNVTIKSNQPPNNTITNGHKITPTTVEKKLLKDPEIHLVTAGSKYYQGISNWADRKETEAAPNQHFASKAFREDLQETIERNRLKKGSAILNSREKLQDNRYTVEPRDSYVSREEIIQQKRQSLSSQFLAKSKRSTSRDKLDDIEPKAVITYGGDGGARSNGGSRTDLRYGIHPQSDNRRMFSKPDQHVDSNELDRRRTRSPSFLQPVLNHKRNDYSEGRAKSYERDLEHIPQEQSTHIYDSKTLNKSVGHDVTEDMNSSSTLGRPTVPQRRRAIEKKLRQQSSITPTLKVPLSKKRELTEPPPDYSPPPRSRSSSPQLDYLARLRQNEVRANIIDPASYTGSAVANSSSTLNRKQNQRTRFAPNTNLPSPSYHPSGPQRPLNSHPPAQATASTISTSTVASHKSSRMGQVIGNSLRKLVNKIRSASAERKLRVKSKSKSREQSPTPHMLDRQSNTPNSTATYQQYNVIDAHIGSTQQLANSSDQESNNLRPPQEQKSEAVSIYGNNNVTHRDHHDFKRSNSADPYGNSRDAEQLASPRQRYYLGEDPYSSTLYGKENIYDPNSVAKRNRQARETLDDVYGQQSNRATEIMYQRREDDDRYDQRNTSANTLGRYHKSNQYIAGSTPNLNNEYRSVQTLPRKLNHSQQQSPQSPQIQSQYQKSTQRIGGYNTLGHPEKRTQFQQSVNIQPSGPAKPARTYAKALNRSKSFNIHGMNGSADPSPIYIEKINRNNYNNNLQSSHVYKSNPHLYSGPSKENTLLQSGLKSPSIVNLISRSQKDLSKIGTNDEEHQELYISNNKRNATAYTNRTQKENFMKGLQQQAPDLYRTIHGSDDDYYSSNKGIIGASSKYQLQPKHSLDSRPPVELNKDTASIIRRGSSSNDDYSTTYNYIHKPNVELPHTTKRVLMYNHQDDQRRRGSGSTIIEVRNINGRK